MVVGGEFGQFVVELGQIGVFDGWLVFVYFVYVVEVMYLCCVVFCFFGEVEQGVIDMFEYVVEQCLQVLVGYVVY